MKTLPRSLFALCLGLTLASPSHALFGWGEKPATGPLGAVLADIAGSVMVKRAAGGDFAAAAAQTALDTGDIVKTGPGGRAVIVFLDGSKMQLKDSGNFSVSAHSAKTVAVKLDVGNLQFWIKKVAGRRRYEMRTPTAVASVRGTQGELDVAPNGETKCALFEGSVSMTDNHGVEVRLEPNQQVTASTEKGLVEAKVEAIPVGKTMEAEPTAATTPPPTTPPATETAKEEPKAEETTEPAPTTTSNPAQNQAVSQSTP